MELKGKKVLLIGSGADLDGRKMQSEIDTGTTYDFIARVNKPYGAIEDVGTKTDVILVRKASWFRFFWRDFMMNRQRMSEAERAAKPVLDVVFNEGVNCRHDYGFFAAHHLGFFRLSTGLLAAKWLKEQGADVTAIGYGWSEGAFVPVKTYTQTKQEDANPNYDWKRENEWIAANVNLI